MQATRTIRVIKVPIEGAASVQTIEDTLPSLCYHVGGKGITTFALEVEGARQIVGLCRNDGLFADPPIPTRWVRAVDHHPIPGTFLVVGQEVSADCYRSLTDEEIQIITASERVF